MTLYDWFPALTTTTVTVFIFWLARQLISTRLTKSVEFEFNEKLEILRSDLRSTEDGLKAEIKSREAEIESLRSGALSAMASRQIALDARRLEAVDQLWTSFNSYVGAKSLCLTLSTIIFEKAAEQSQKDSKARDLFASLGSGFDPKSIDHLSAQRARPFVNEIVWATYSAYIAICMHAVLRWNILRFGFGSSNLIDNEAVKNLIISALPSQSASISEYGPDSYYIFLNALEIKLLDEIKKMLTGAESDQSSIQQAADILLQSNALIEKVNKFKDQSK